MTRSRLEIGKSLKSTTTSNRSATPCQSSEVTLTGLGRKLPSVEITVIGTRRPRSSTRANFQNRDMPAVRMRKRYFLGSTSKNGL